ncbi:MAG: hypothetical protein RDU20_07895 [Desulfomonilaceae bacterium]|nr:hypothetical protein [Desulfomonilaceae bacterium]
MSIRPGDPYRRSSVYTYSAYGLGIRCDVPLPDLIESDAAHDVVMRFGRAEPLEPVPPDARLSLQFKGDRAFFLYRGLGACLVVQGREIVGEPDEGMDDQVIPVMAQGPGLSVLLHQRGYLTLHASCVQVGGQAVAFVGDSGSGKSTTAAALVSRGHALVADDVTVVRNSGSMPVAFPGYPGLHLLPDAAEYFGKKLGEPSAQDVEEEKLTFRRDEGFPSRPVPLARIYLLHEGPDLGIAPVSGHESVYELVKNSYWIRLMHDARPSSYFLQCARLATQVPVLRLTRPRDVSLVAEIAGMIEHGILKESGDARNP